MAPPTAVVATVLALTSSLYLLLSTGGARGQSPMVHEPVEQLKSHLPKNRDDMSEKLHQFLQNSSPKLKSKASKMETNLRTVLKDRDHVSAFLVKGQTVLAQRAAPGFQFNTTFLLPNTILLSILSTTLPILLEGYKASLITDPIGSILKEKHRDNEAVREYLSLSLHDLVTKLPQSGKSVDLNSDSLFMELDKRGRAAFFYVKTVLESVAEDAWRDALISVAMDSSAFAENHQMLTHLQDLSRYAEALGGDILNFYEVAKSDLVPTDGGHFLYGWWINCPRTRDKTRGKCLAPFLPSNTLVILHPLIRVYTIATQSLHLLVANGDNSTPKTISQILLEDQLVWKAVYRVVDPSQSSAKPKEEKMGGNGGEKKGKEATEPPQAKDSPTEPPQVKDGPTEPPQDTDSSTEPSSKKLEQTSPKPPEDEVVGDSVPRKKGPTGGKQPSPPSVKRDEEDEVVEEPRKPSRRGEVKKEEAIHEEEENGAKTADRSLVVWLIYTCWPFAVFLFYTIFSHVWVYWIMHLAWLVSSSLFRGVYLPRPKTAKED